MDSLTSASGPSSSLDVKALLDGRPPAMDRFSYLTLIEQHLSADVLPTLHEVLQDAPLTQEIGWDLVDMLVPLLPVSEACLDDVARLGNPREVIIKVLDVLDGLRRGADGEEKGGGVDDDLDDAQEAAHSTDHSNDRDLEITPTFVILLGMLGVLHRRIKTKYPSRFLETTLRTILAAYRPERPAMTTAILGLVRSLAHRRRPPPPVRRSDSQLNAMAMSSPPPPPRYLLQRSTSAIGKVAHDDGDGPPDDAAVAMPDPEAEDQVAPGEQTVQQRLLQSFVTCVLEAYVNVNDITWAPRLVEFYNPRRLVPGRLSELDSFREDPDKMARDSAVSQLVALALDLGLENSDNLIQSVCHGPVRRHPLDGLDLAGGDDDHDAANRIPLSTGGVLCLLAYWVFSADVFQADAPTPRLTMFPDHAIIVASLIQDGTAAAEIARVPGTIEAVLTLGLWLQHHKQYGTIGDADADADATATQDGFMAYHYQLMLCAVFHSRLAVRNAAAQLAGVVLHAHPAPRVRLQVLQDLLESCMFPALKACAVTWLREEILAAAAASAATKTKEAPVSDSGAAVSPFATPEAIEQLQYVIFPNLQALQEVAHAKPEYGTDPTNTGGDKTGSDGSDAEDDNEDTDSLNYWQQNAPFLLQAVNFAYFLFCSDKCRATVVPPGMGPAVEQRYAEPLLAMAARLRTVLRSAEAGAGTAGQDALSHVVLDLEVLTSRLKSISWS